LAREFLIVWAGRHRRDRWEDLCASYRERIERFGPVRELAVRARESGDGRERLRVEGEALLAALPDPCRLVALDRRGEAVSSEALARRLAAWRDEWPHPIAFVLGSDLGLDEETVLERARWRWSLGPLTLPHELARLVVYEQLYRALCIAAGINYHRQPL
jgi:23S rRNA (pseudouridine1915-N3)-methyltransferase